MEATVLIVDDEPAIRDMVCIALESAGFNSMQAENAADAHTLIIDEDPDVVLLDWMMPGTSGLERCAACAVTKLPPRFQSSC